LISTLAVSFAPGNPSRLFVGEEFLGVRQSADLGDTFAQTSSGMLGLAVRQRSKIT
jgi:hypothetical protein